MAKPTFIFRGTTLDEEKVRVVSFEIPGGVTTPQEFADSVGEIKDSLSGEFGIILDGRGPVWGFGMLIHESHPTKWIAVRDPRLGAVVVATHNEARRTGDIIPFPAE